MEDNIYQAPETNIDDPHPYRYTGSAWIGIASGTTIEVAGTILATVIIAILYPFFLPTDIDAASLEFLSQMETLENISATINHIVLALISVFASYTCARIINHHEYLYIAIQYVLVTTIFYGLMSAPDSMPYDATEIAINITVYFAGAYIHRRKKLHALSSISNQTEADNKQAADQF